MAVVQAELIDGKGSHIQDEANFLPLLGRAMFVLEHVFHWMLACQDRYLAHGHMPEVPEATTTQAYRTENQRTQTYKARQPCWGTHAPYNTRGFELIKQRNGAASSEPGFIAMKMLDVILTQLPAVVIAIPRIEVGEP